MRWGQARKLLRSVAEKMSLFWRDCISAHGCAVQVDLQAACAASYRTSGSTSGLGRRRQVSAAPVSCQWLSGSPAGIRRNSANGYEVLILNGSDRFDRQGDN